MELSQCLTPIKISGKRKIKVFPDEDQNGATRPNPRQRLSPGRPPKSRASSTSNINLKMHKKSRKLKNIKSRLLMAKLESLPAEILQVIFLLSLNISLPASSPVIAAKLSGHRIYIQTIKQAFGPTWEFSCQRYAMNLPWTSDNNPSGVVPGDHNLQSTVLRLRWANLKVLREAETEWIRQRRDDYILPHSNEESGDIHLDDVSFDQDYQDFRSLRSASSNLSDGLENCIHGLLRVHPRTEVPDSLLEGPWSEEMIKHLFWIVRAGAEIGWAESTGGEIAMRGLRRAMMAGNEDVLYLFSRTTIVEGVTDEDVLWTVKNAGGNLDQVVRYVAIMFLRRTAQKNQDWTGRSKRVNSCIETNDSLLEAAIDQMKNDRIGVAEDMMLRWIRSFEIARHVSSGLDLNLRRERDLARKHFKPNLDKGGVEVLIAENNEIA